MTSNIYAQIKQKKQELRELEQIRDKALGSKTFADLFMYVNSLVGNCYKDNDSYVYINKVELKDDEISVYIQTIRITKQPEIFIHYNEMVKRTTARENYLNKIFFKCVTEEYNDSTKISPDKWKNIYNSYVCLVNSMGEK